MNETPYEMLANEGLTRVSALNAKGPQMAEWSKGFLPSLADLEEWSKASVAKGNFFAPLGHQSFVIASLSPGNKDDAAALDNEHDGWPTGGTPKEAST